MESKVLIHNAIKNKIDKIAIISNNREITYSEFFENFSSLGSFLKNRLAASSRIGMILKNSIEAAETMYACSHAEMILVPLDFNIQLKNLEYIVNDCEVSLIITNERIYRKFKDYFEAQKIAVLLIEDFKENKKNILHLAGSGLQTFSNNANIATILYTTGTTGPKKGVMLGHDTLIEASKNINDFMQIGDWVVESSPMPLSHSFGFARMRCVLESGGTLILEDSFIRPEKILYNMKKYNANGLSSVPTGFSIMLKCFFSVFKEVAQNIKYIEIGSAFMRDKYKQHLMQLMPQARLCMHYGLTEASRACFINFNSEKDYLHTVGRPSPNVDVEIRDKKGVSLGRNEVGQIYIKGKMLLKGYWKKDDLFKKNYRDNWFNSNDIGMIDDNGYIHLYGRKDDIMNIGGLKVAPGEVEEIILKHPEIAEVAVVGFKNEDDISNETIASFIVPNSSDFTLNIESLQKFCLQFLEPYKIPKQMEIVKELPKTNSGKIQRHLLKENERTLLYDKRKNI